MEKIELYSIFEKLNDMGLVIYGHIYYTFRMSMNTVRKGYIQSSII